MSIVWRIIGKKKRKSRKHNKKILEHNRLKPIWDCVPQQMHSPHILTSEIDIKNWKPLKLSKWLV